MIELCKLIHIVPDLLTGGMENMCPILMDLNPFNLFRINISSYMVTLVNDQTGLSFFGSLMGKYSAK